ncbi:MAG: hypothetical protein ABJL67_12700 [Sulfitobacter sp.]
MADRSTKSVAHEQMGPWMSQETLAKLPQLKRGFDGTRDAATAAAHRDLGTSEAQRRSESIAYYARMAQDRGPAPVKRAGMSAQVNAAVQSARIVESQTRNGSHGGQSGGASRASSMVSKSQPMPAPKPPGNVARRVDANAFEGSWMREQRDAAMAQAKARPAQSLEATHAFNRSEPVRER